MKNCRKLFLIGMFFSFLASPIHAVITFERWYGGINTDIGNSVVQITTSTTIHLLGIGHSAEGKELKIYNITGRLVKKLSLPTAYSQLPTGVTWDGWDNEGREVQGGVYFLKVGGECIGKVVKVK